MLNKASKSKGLLQIYEMLLKGQVVKKSQMADRLGVSPKTVSRYIADINAYLSDTEKLKHVKYSRKEDGYILEFDKDEYLNSKDILIISKILLESRGLYKKELNKIITKLLNHCPYRDRAYVKRFIGNEIENYVEPKHREILIDKIWDISEAICRQRVVEIAYTKIGNYGELDQEVVNRKLEPEAIIFSEYYFYLIASIKDKSFEYPAIYRLDRIKDYKISKEGFERNYKERFKEGEYRNLIQFMQPGKLQIIKFVFKGKSIEAVLDRLPNAKIIEKNKGTYLVEAKVFGEGIKMWLLSQGDGVEVLEPISFREEVKTLVKRILDNYNK